MKEIKFKHDGILTLVVLDDYGDGMQFKYGSTGKVYSMLTIGEPTATAVRNLIAKYDNNKQ